MKIDEHVLTQHHPMGQACSTQQHCHEPIHLEADLRPNQAHQHHPEHPLGHACGT